MKQNTSIAHKNKIRDNILWNDSEFHGISLHKHTQLKQFVYALFTQLYEKSGYEFRNRFIFNVDQIGLEPMTSRL